MKTTLLENAVEEGVVSALAALNTAACVGGAVESVMRTRALTEIAERLNADQLVKLAHQAATDPKSFTFR